MRQLGQPVCVELTVNFGDSQLSLRPGGNTHVVEFYLATNGDANNLACKNWSPHSLAWVITHETGDHPPEHLALTKVFPRVPLQSACSWLQDEIQFVIPSAEIIEVN